MFAGGRRQTRRGIFRRRKVSLQLAAGACAPRFRPGYDLAAAERRHCEITPHGWRVVTRIEGPAESSWPSPCACKCHADGLIATKRGSDDLCPWTVQDSCFRMSRWWTLSRQLPFKHDTLLRRMGDEPVEAKPCREDDMTSKVALTRSVRGCHKTSSSICSGRAPPPTPQSQLEITILVVKKSPLMLDLKAAPNCPGSNPPLGIRFGENCHPVSAQHAHPCPGCSRSGS